MLGPVFHAGLCGLGVVAESNSFSLGAKYVKGSE